MTTRADLESAGFVIGKRDERLNTDFPGAFMVAESYGNEDTPTQDGRNGPWCIVGDDLDSLIAEACQYWTAEDFIFPNLVRE